MRRMSALVLVLALLGRGCAADWSRGAALAPSRRRSSRREWTLSFLEDEGATGDRENSSGGDDDEETRETWSERWPLPAGQR